ncbi:hypothetical protein J421_6111 (plasmid) [Gemmatirosa kalamazoonensis]|uniref:DUF5916 domain-containing protein n=1 Tax=Gemmatirosa kalamazoonensis TaxID=861299 RepID=W0RSH3_9BACT|nr:carbohydrate binding family 9 domain-containing protein [Gemmatirosa kalamazoonensis]AHG93646.1 hypothetical protein J421_6111 [Gemmatirosa kalamazoonensis]
MSLSVASLLRMLLLAAPALDPALGGPVFDGRSGATAVSAPRLATSIIVDGRLDEPAWARAAVLGGFSQYAPVDGVPAVDSTTVRVWYSPTAIHFGVVAYEAHGAPHATLAQRDHIAQDDYVEIYLGTFHDGRHALVFGVNPLGAQADGILTETGNIATSGVTSAAATRETPDLSPDFVFESKGHVTPWGYEVEVRIPFKSLKYQPADPQRWTLEIVRHVQHSGAEDTWTPTRRGAASFLAQAGTLEGLTGLHRGLVLDATPEWTVRTTGAPDPAGDWRYGRAASSLGGSARWGATNDLTLDATVRPDFSQVESDEGQLVTDPRFALFFPEKRPFFLDGIEQMEVPNGLIYTRRLVQPQGALKLIGRVAGADVAALSAVDDRAASLDGAHPIANVLRVRRSLPNGVQLGAAYTDRVDGARSNRVADVDARARFGGVYAAQLQLAASRTGGDGAVRTGPLWDARLSRNGQRFGFRYELTAIDPDFDAQLGFIQRPAIAHLLVEHRVTRVNATTDVVQRITGDVTLDGTWKYDRFVSGRDALEKKLHLNVNGVLRGGWQASATAFIERFGFDPDLYAGYHVIVPNGSARDTVPFGPRPAIPNLDWALSLATPQFHHVSASAFYVWGHDENFFEWASGAIGFALANVTWRPTDQLRVSGQYQGQWYYRRPAGDLVARDHIPRVRVEYQLTRAVFVRVVSEYRAQQQTALRDDTRGGAPIVLRDPVTGRFAAPAPFRRSSLRAEGLFSYQPVPGTVVFLGYGGTSARSDALALDGLRRESDALFLKASWLFRR